MSLALCGSMFAQYTSYWANDFYGGDYEDNSSLVAAIMIDGVIVTLEYEGWDALEVAPFVGEQCRGNAFNFLFDGVTTYGDPYPTLDGMPINFTTPGEVVSFKLYDHINGILYEDGVASLLGEPITILTGEDHQEGWFPDEYAEPVILSFTSPTPPEPEAHYWFDPDAWDGGDVPDEGQSVVNLPDSTLIIIPADSTVIAGTVNIPATSTLVMEPGSQFYHSNEVTVTVQMGIESYVTRDNAAGFRLIASPIDPNIEVDATGLTAEENGTVDLYKFDQTQQYEWRNYKDNQFTTLDIKNGYLFASQNVGIAAFIGSTLSTTGTTTQTLVRDANAGMKGWNLLGNPYTCTAYIDREFYVMNAAGDEIILSEVDGIPVLKGFFVHAETDGETVTFSTSPFEEKSSLVMNLTQGRAVIDRAIVRFGGNSTLPKFNLNQNSSKLYIPQDGEDYAVVSAREMGEMPVSFKAEQSGSYTMSFNADGVSFNYLHLIDNKTGADVDLLATPSYSFDALTTDYASRFRLVFATGNNSNDDNFAFFSNGNLVINNEGNATLQVIDMTGRILSSETINGSASISLSGAAGVYMIRLINGENVKVQKVVVR